MVASAVPDLWAAVEFCSLGRTFGSVDAVKDANFTIPAGTTFGLVGPNGAGKTTLIRMATGLLRPTSGSVRVRGTDVWPGSRRVKREIGVLPEGLELFDRLKGGELLEYTGMLRSMPAAHVRSRAEELLDVLGLGQARDRLVVDYSKGMRKKIGLAAALLHNPSVLFLDEPFEGVDPVSAATIRGVLERFRARGATIILSSHVMTTVEFLCSRVAVIDRGRILAEGTIAEVAGGRTLDEAFVEMVGGVDADEAEVLPWLGC